jgi:hypothetical protein
MAVVSMPLPTTLQFTTDGITMGRSSDLTGKVIVVTSGSRELSYHDDNH